MIPSHDEIEVPDVVRHDNETESTRVQQKEISIITKGKRVKSKEREVYAEEEVTPR